MLTLGAQFWFSEASVNSLTTTSRRQRWPNVDGSILNSMLYHYQNCQHTTHQQRVKHIHSFGEKQWNSCLHNMLKKLILSHHGRWLSFQLVKQNCTKIEMYLKRYSELELTSRKRQRKTRRIYGSYTSKATKEVIIVGQKWLNVTRDFRVPLVSSVRLRGQIWKKK